MSVVIEPDVIELIERLDEIEQASPPEKKILEDAYALLSDRSRWCGGGMAKTAEGTWTDVWDDNATQWCALGALYKAAGRDAALDENEHSTELVRSVVEAVTLALVDNGHSYGIVRTNDCVGGYEKVMAAIKMAIARL